MIYTTRSRPYTRGDTDSFKRMCQALGYQPLTCGDISCATAALSIGNVSGALRTGCAAAQVANRRQAGREGRAMTRPILLDCFCGAGGAAKGYYEAGFDVVGIDINPQPRYPYEFHQCDALEFLRKADLSRFAAVHASPPCQGYSVSATMTWTRGYRGEVPMLVDAVRELLDCTGLPYVIENVKGAPMLNAIELCGLMFGLKVFRHRLFETNFLIMQPPHPSHYGKRVGEGGMCCVCGHGDAGRGRIPADHRDKKSWQLAMNIGWMTKKEMAESIPPAYSNFVGSQLILETI